MGLARIDDYVVDLEVDGGVDSESLAIGAAEISDWASAAA
jgi:hypothetical protein